MTPQERQDRVRLMGARRQWWDSRPEPVFEPGWEIIDAHVHLWEARDFPDPSGAADPLATSRYLLPEFLADAGSGHDLTHFVYVECGSGYLAQGPEFMRPVGEAQFAAANAAELARRGSRTAIGAMVAHADLRHRQLDALLDAYAAHGDGLVRGVRQSGARLEDPAARLIVGAAPPGLYADPAFRRGICVLGERGLTFDAFVFHFQLDELFDLARAAPGTTIVINHTGTPIGHCGRAGPGDPVFEAWRRQVDRLCEMPNLVMKLGGLASIVTGYDGHSRELPPSSGEFIAERGAYFRHAIERFGAERCMFESNFPVDSASIGYVALWNAYKKLAAERSAIERRALLGGTARKTYRI